MHGLTNIKIKNTFGHILQTAMYRNILAHNQVVHFVKYIQFQVYWDQMVTLQLLSSQTP